MFSSPLAEQLAPDLLDRFLRYVRVDTQSERNRTLMVGVTALRGQYSDNIPLFAGGVLVAALPVILVYLFFQKQITDGVTAGATKG